jgi:hypothetical protein
MVSLRDKPQALCRKGTFLSRRDIPRIAQRFNAGKDGHNRPIQAPPGAAETLEFWCAPCHNGKKDMHIVLDAAHNQRPHLVLTSDATGDGARGSLCQGWRAEHGLRPCRAPVPSGVFTQGGALPRLGYYHVVPTGLGFGSLRSHKGQMDKVEPASRPQLSGRTSRADLHPFSGPGLNCSNQTFSGTTYGWR